MVVLDEIQVENELGITGYSTKWVLNMLKEHCDDYIEAKGNNNVVDIEAVDVSEGKGYASRVFVTTVTFDGGESFKVAMKVPTYSIIEEKFKGMVDLENHDHEEGRLTLERAHNMECDAISMVSNFPDFPSPKVYYTQKTRQHDCGLPGKESPGIIVMRAVDGASIGLINSVTADQCLTVAKDLAVFQDYIRQLPEAEWKGKYDCRVHFEKSSFDACKAGMSRLKDENPEEFSEVNELFNNLDWVAYSTYALKTRAAKLNATTYVHGDVWSNNVMFKKYPDGSVGSEALAYIDYQIGFEGNPLFDIARFITVCADAEVRREVTEKALKTYYEKLNELFRKRGEKPKCSFAEVEELYELAFIQQTFALIIIGSFIATEEVAPDVMEARLAKIKLRTKLALLDAAMIWKKRNLTKLFQELKIFA